MKSLSLEQPHAIIMVGIPGSGKSFFAQKFAETFGAPYLEQALLGEFIQEAKVLDEVTKHFIQQFARTKQSIVLEVDTASRGSREDLVKLLKSHGYQTLFVWVQTDADTSAARSQKLRSTSLSQHMSEVKRFSPPHPAESALVISGKHTYPSQAKIVLKRLTGPRVSQAVQPREPVSPPRSNIVVR